MSGVLTVGELARRLETRIPASLREPWDHDGVMVLPDPDEPVRGVLCALDCTGEVVEAAKKRACNVILTHHPLLFHPLPVVSPSDSVGKRVLACVRAGIAVLSYHTRLDCMEGGVNDCLAALLELRAPEPFVPYGRVGGVPEGYEKFNDFAAFVGRKLGVTPFPTVKARETVRRVALVAGCGKDEIAAVLAAGADTFVTGEVLHNHLIDCRELGLNLLCVTHAASETPVLPFLAGLATQCGAVCTVYGKENHGV